MASAGSDLIFFQQRQKPKGFKVAPTGEGEVMSYKLTLIGKGLKPGYKFTQEQICSREREERQGSKPRTEQSFSTEP